MSRANAPVHPMQEPSSFFSDQSGEVTEHPGERHGGLTIREHFAISALQGLLAGECSGERWTTLGAATRAVAYADALIAELAKAQS